MRTSLQLTLLASAVAFDASKFRGGCNDSPFCRSARPGSGTPPAFELVAGSLALEKGVVSASFWQPVVGLNSTAALRLSATASARGPPIWTARLTGERNRFRASSLLSLPRGAAAEVSLRSDDAAGVHVLRAEGGEAGEK